MAARNLNHRMAWRAASVALALLLPVLMSGCRAALVPDPEKRIAEGWTWYRSGDFGFASSAFASALVDARTDGVLRQQALYGLASTWNLRRPDENPERAASYYREVIDAAPKSDLAAWSSLAMARMRAMPVAGESVDLKEQINAYQVVIDAFPSFPAGEEAFVFQQAARLSDAQAGEEQATLAALEEYVKVHPQTPWRGSIFHLIAHCCEVLGRKKQWLEATIEEWKANEATAAQTTFAQTTFAPTTVARDRTWIYWRVATLAEFEVGDFDLAREYYRKLIAEYPTEQRVFLAKQELKRMDAQEAILRAEIRSTVEATR